MKMTLIWLTVLILFTCLMFIPYLYERIARAGLVITMGYSNKIHKGIAAWAERCKAAHMNALEGLVVIVPLVLIGVHLKLDLLVAVQVYFFARLVHFLSYAFAVPYLRTLAFFVMLGVILYMGCGIFCKLTA